MTLAELLEKSREIPENSDVFAVPVDDERNRAGATFEVDDVFFDLDNAEPTYIWLRKPRFYLFRAPAKMSIVAR